jgi:adenylylsulfate kinase
LPRTGLFTIRDLKVARWGGYLIAFSTLALILYLFEQLENVDEVPNYSNPSNIFWHKSVTRDFRWSQFGTKGATVWFTGTHQSPSHQPRKMLNTDSNILPGLSGSGKSTVAAAVEKVLLEKKILAYLLDGDNVRFGLNSDLQFSRQDRAESTRRAGETSKLFADAGFIMLDSFISPYEEDRNFVKRIHKESNLDFYLIWVDTPLSVCEQRDPKGLYKKARAKEITNFTGIDSPFEPPLDPDLILDTSLLSVEECVELVLHFLQANNVIPN